MADQKKVSNTTARVMIRVMLPEVNTVDVVELRSAIMALVEGQKGAEVELSMLPPMKTP